MAAMNPSSREPPGSHTSISPHKIAVVGTGSLGTRIAGELALCGCTVRVHDLNSANLQTVHSRIAGQLEELREGGLLPPHFQLQGSVIVESVLSSAVSGADLVVEAVVDDLDIKISIFQDIASLCSERTILSSNSLNLPLDEVFQTVRTILSSNSLNLPLDEVFQTVPSPGRSVGVRFLYPVYLIDRVEMTPHHTTSDNTTDKVRSFLLGLGKRVFQRGEGGTPLKLTAQEAQQTQRENSCSQYYSDQIQKH